MNTIKSQTEKFIAALENKDIVEVQQLFSEEVIFDDVPVGFVQGKENAVKKLTSFFAMADSIKWEIHRFLIDNNIVAVERTNHISLNKKNIKLQMVSIIEFDGKNQIKLFRDYFDLKTLESQLNF